MSAPVVHASSCVSPLGARTPDPTNEALAEAREQFQYCRRYAIIPQGAKRRGCIIAMRVPYPAANVNRIRRLAGISPNSTGIG